MLIQERDFILNGFTIGLLVKKDDVVKEAEGINYKRQKIDYCLFKYIWGDTMKSSKYTNTAPIIFDEPFDDTTTAVGVLVLASNEDVVSQNNFPREITVRKATTLTFPPGYIELEFKPKDEE